MGRPRRDYLAWTNGVLVDYATWCQRFLIDAGYPHCTVEARMMESGNATGGSQSGCKVPNVSMPTMVKEVDRALRYGVPEDILVVIHRHYFDHEKVGRRQLTEALMFLAGKLR